MKFIVNVVSRYWLSITVLLLVSISILSLWPAENLPQVPGTDKTHHFISYGALVLPVALRKPTYWLVFVLGFAGFSGIIELIQPYVNRVGDWLDMAANVAGLACGMTLARIIEYYLKNKT